MEFKNDDEKNYLIWDNNIENSFGLQFSEKLKNIFSDDYKKNKLQIKNYSNINDICKNNNNWIEEERLILIMENEKNQLNNENNINDLIEDSDMHKSIYINIFENSNINSKIKILFSSYFLVKGGLAFQMDILIVLELKDV